MAKTALIKSRVEKRAKVYLEHAAAADKMPLSRFIQEACYARCQAMILDGRWKAKSPPPIRDHRRKDKS